MYPIPPEWENVPNRISPNHNEIIVTDWAAPGPVDVTTCGAPTDLPLG